MTWIFSRQYPCPRCGTLKWPRSDCPGCDGRDY